MLNVEKSFSIEIAASVYSGILCCDDFSKVHECMEWVKGHPVWTHEMGSGDAFYKEIKQQIKDQSDCKFEGLTKENALNWVKERKGQIVFICKGSEERDKHPLQTLQEKLNK